MTRGNTVADIFDLEYARNMDIFLGEKPTKHLYFQRERSATGNMLDLD